MNVFRKWWKREISLVDWTPGSKHPDTHTTVFRNCWGWDLLRRVLLSKNSGTCCNCGYILSDREINIQEIFALCDDAHCKCNKAASSSAHQVCGLCYDMWCALYSNYSLKDANYFRNLNGKKDGDWRDKRDKLGL